MDAQDFRRLLDWAERGGSDEAFWRRLWIAASAYDWRTAVHIRSMVAQFGKLALDNAAKIGYNESVP